MRLSTMWKIVLIVFCGASVASVSLIVASDSEVPSCPQNEIYSNCSNALCRALSCEHKGLTVACASVSSCDKSCVCAWGFLRNTKGICVPEDECDVGPTCPENQVFSNCSNAICRHQYCEERGQPIGCPAVSSCDKGCVCDVGFLRFRGGNCVKHELCDEAPSCPKNQVFSNCSNALCREQKCEEKGIPVACPSVPFCEKSCVCAVGFLKNSEGFCVKESECDVGPKCPENQVFSNCTNGVCRHQECYERGQPVVCPKLSPDDCRTGCVCDVGYLRNTNGHCVKKEECDTM